LSFETFHVIGRQRTDIPSAFEKNYDAQIHRLKGFPMKNPVILMSPVTLLLCIAIACFTTACNQGFDRKPDISSVQAYTATVQHDLKGMPQNKIDAYTWAVSDLNLETLTQNYKNKTYGEIAQAEIDKELQLAMNEKASLEPLRQKFDPLITELTKVSAEALRTRFVVAEANLANWMSANPSGVVCDLKVNNGSALKFTSLSFVATLYINGSDTPMATASIYKNYKDKGGLKPGATEMETISIHGDSGFSQNGRNWDTLEVQNAKQIKVEVSLDEAMDFSEKNILDGAPYKRLEELESIIKTAETHKAAFAK
jgi:hypothetical protein